MNWQDLVVESHYQTAEAVKAKLLEGDIEEAKTGIEELVDALGRSEKRAVESQLSRLMMHVIKWKIQPERRSRSWVLTIRNARREIQKSQREMPSLNNHYLRSIWDECFRDARGDTEVETGLRINLSELRWEEVFEDDYSLPLRE